MWRLLFVVVLACQPKQPLQASYFNAERANQGPPNCERTLACYARCNPLTEECMLMCDQVAPSGQVQRARAVNNCSATYGCLDDTCTQERCASELQMCKAPPMTAAPSPMRPAPIMTPTSAGSPAAMHPPPPMQPRPMYPPPPPPHYYR